MKIRLLIALLALGLALPSLASAQAAGTNPYVKLTTNQGEIVLELDSAAAPKTTANFIKYVEDGHYNGTIFHRVISTFMIQGGGFDKDMKELKTRAPIANEANNGLKNNRYTVAMARTSDPQSASAQFFINTADNGPLNFTAETSQGWGYAVFGKVVKGQETVDKIAKVRTGSIFGHENVPVVPVIIEKAEIVKNF